ncbi:ABC transporter substrate-binding protein [Defluviimonas sp. WL0024]|uniref:ABC transporter substrate-binding protein n=1 Tax=Albidovulum salinarum TaxID=2984153 RepID=A0ABT2X0V5_9RHOB|nr:ABC transporter substrate-binding protein [Defluviimonas sp. WL0024]MCU9847575.1 ABC transporter substrate-binding protein [Defluviimonas sp. WL0024]
MKTTVLKAAIAGGALALSAQAALAECGEVSITEMNWASAAVVTSVSKFLMENGYGCTVTVVPSSTLPAVTSIAETGEPDIATELWINTAPAYPELESAGKVKTLGDVLSDGGVEAFWIPQYLADEHPELTTMEGILANPALVGGKFHNCPEGWGCRVTNDNIVKAWDFEGSGLEVFNHGSGETLAAAIASAYENKEPWFGYYWAPTSVLGKYPMAMVNIGEFDADTHACNASADCATPGKSPYPSARVVTAVTTTFADSNPEVAEMMSKVTFTNEQMNEVLAWQEDNKASADEATAHFLTTYKDVWGAWLNDDARGKLAALLE